MHSMVMNFRLHVEENKNTRDIMGRDELTDGKGDSHVLWTQYAVLL